MFGRHPRLAVDAFLGIKPCSERSDKSKYVTDLKKRLCGHLLGKGWPLGSRLWCLLWVCHFPIGILSQVWYLIVSIPDFCTITYFNFAYKTASRDAHRQGRRHKSVYDLTWESENLSCNLVIEFWPGTLEWEEKGKLLTDGRRMFIWWWTSQIKTYLFTLLNVSMAEASAECFIEICCSHSWLFLHLNQISWTLACQLVVPSRYRWLLQIQLTVLTKWIWQTLHLTMRSVLQSQKTQEHSLSASQISMWFHQKDLGIRDPHLIL